MPYRLEVTGRYQHAAPYVASALEGAGFEVVRISREKLRMELRRAGDGTSGRRAQALNGRLAAGRPGRRRARFAFAGEPR